MSDVIDGKRVLGPPKDIREVQNAYDAYEMLIKLNPYSIGDLLAAHKIMMLDLVKEAGIFHYEFEFIHPFADGNGRTGRMWHTLILAKWKEFFLWLPIETLIHEQQEEYYGAINAANTGGESTVFVKFMLEIIKMALEELTQNVTEENKSDNSSIQDRILELLKSDNKISAKNAAVKLDMSERQIQRLLKTMKDEGKIERVGSNRNGSWIVKK